MIAHREGAGENRVAHAGTFNANPVSAAAGTAALRLVATGEPNATADARATTLRAGLNDLLTRLEVPGCCYGVASIFQIRLGAQCQCSDAEHLHPAEGQPASSPAVAGAMRLAAINAGIDLMAVAPPASSPQRAHRGRHPGNPGLLRGCVRRAPRQRAAVGGRWAGTGGVTIASG